MYLYFNLHLNLNFTFPLAEHLKSRKAIAALFRDGQTYGVYPLRAFWTFDAGPHRGVPVQTAFSVPKKNYPHAVDRNRIRRQLRETFRLQKHPLYHKFAGQEHTLSLMFLYVSKEPVEYSLIEQSMKRLLKKISIPAQKTL